LNFRFETIFEIKNA